MVDYPFRRERFKLLRKTGSKIIYVPQCEYGAVIALKLFATESFIQLI